MEIVDLMSGVGGAFIGYHAVRLFGLACFRMGAAVREWRYQRPANAALRLAEYAMKQVDSNNDWIVKRHAAFEERFKAIENASHGVTRVAILEERIEDIEDLLITQADPAKGVCDCRDAERAYFDKRGKSN